MPQIHNANYMDSSSINRGRGR